MPLPMTHPPLHHPAHPPLHLLILPCSSALAIRPCRYGFIRLLVAVFVTIDPLLPPLKAAEPDEITEEDWAKAVVVGGDRVSAADAHLPLLGPPPISPPRPHHLAGGMGENRGNGWEWGRTGNPSD